MIWTITHLKCNRSFNKGSPSIIGMFIGSVMGNTSQKETRRPVSIPSMQHKPYANTVPVQFHTCQSPNKNLAHRHVRLTPGTFLNNYTWQKNSCVIHLNNPQIQSIQYIDKAITTNVTIYLPGQYFSSSRMWKTLPKRIGREKGRLYSWKFWRNCKWDNWSVPYKIYSKDIIAEL